MEEKEVLNNTEDTKTDDIDTVTEIDTLNEKIAELNDKYLRTAAELENIRRRAALDAESTARNRVISIAENFLPLMEAIDAAITQEPK